MVQELMVMENPSPQSVGLQFVQQYYTMLNKAPAYLHRFYSTNSTFLRGGLDSAGKMETAVQGQPAIHNKIMELNFRDCHTKIIMVDSQVTVGDGVVIQVSGELSNNGQPLRRFMQTFVLALQSPKQYYVQNDILRYQDDVFPDDDENDIQEGSGELGSESEHVDSSNNVHDPSLSHYYGQHSLNNGTAHVDEQTVQTPIAVTPSTPVVPLNVVTHPPVATVHPVTPVQSVVAPVIQQSVAVVPETSVEDVSDSKQDYSLQSVDVYEEKSPSKSPELTYDNLSESVNDEPKTYATMVSKKSSPSISSPNTSNVVGPCKVVPGIASSQPPMRTEMRTNDSYTSSYEPPQPHRPPRTRPMNIRSGSNNGNGSNYPPMSNRDRMSSSRGGSEDPADIDRRRTGPQYPDNQQIFIGNLPVDVDENELRDVFSRFGPVVDIRISGKPGGKQGGNRNTPYFGFVTFEDPSIVQRILMEKPSVVLRDSRRLNVEEKKNKIRDSGTVVNNGNRGMPRFGPNPGRGGHMMGGGGMRGGNRGGMGGGGGMVRGGGGRGTYRPTNSR